MRDLAFAFIWAVLFPVALWSAHVGVLLWIWVALISPNEQLYGFMQGVPFNKVVAGVTVLVLFFNRIEKKRFYSDPTVMLMLLIAVIGTFAVINPLIPSDDGMDLYQKLLKEFALALLITGLMYTRHRIHMTVAVFCISIGFTSVVEGLEFIVSAGGHKILGTGSVGDNNSLALAVLMMMPPLAYLIRYTVMKPVRLVMIAVLGISVVTVIGTYSRGGFVGLLLIGGFLIASSRRKFPMILAAVLGAVIVFMVAPDDWFSRIDSIKDASDNNSFLQRVVAWKISTLIAMGNPLVGGGFHAVQRYPTWMQYRGGIGIFDFFPTPDPDDYPHAAHSIYFEVLGDLGFIGFAAFVAVLGVALANCIAVVRIASRHPSLLWAGDLARMLLISILVYMVSGALLSMAYYEGIWIVVAVISRLRRTVREAVAELGTPGLGSADSVPVRRDQRVPIAARQAL